MTMPRKRERTRSAILHVALDRFASHGYDKTSMSDVAAAAGVVRQTVLNHFPRKEELVLAWGERRRALLLERLEPPAPQESAITRLHRIYATLADMNEQERQLGQALHPVYAVVARIHDVPDAVIHAVEDGQGNGEIEPDVPAQTFGEILTAVYFDTLARWLEAVEPPALGPVLTDRIAVVLRGARPDTQASAIKSA